MSSNPGGPDNHGDIAAKRVRIEVQRHLGVTGDVAEFVGVGRGVDERRLTVSQKPDRDRLRSLPLMVVSQMISSFASRSTTRAPNVVLASSVSILLPFNNLKVAGQSHLPAAQLHRCDSDGVVLDESEYSVDHSRCSISSRYFAIYAGI